MGRVIKAAEFKAQCLRLLDEVEQTGESIVVTKRGRRVAQLSPIPKVRRKDIVGFARNMVVFMGDVISPIDIDWGPREPNL